MEVTKFKIENIFKEQPIGRMNWSEEEYVSYTGALGSSQIRAFLRSPNAFRQLVIDQKPRREKDAFKYGRAVHCYLLERDRFESTYMILPTAEKLGFKDFRTNAAKAKREEYLAMAAVKKCILLDEEDYTDMVTIAENISRHETAKDVIANGEPEVTLVFRDPITGIYLKVRIDFLSFAGKMITEVKTTSKSVSHMPFGGEIFGRGYDVQVALQIMACMEVLKTKPLMNNILGIQKEEKEIAGYELTGRQIDNAWAKLRFALDGIKKCIDENNWPMKQKTFQEAYEPKNYQDQQVEQDEQEAYEHFEGDQA